MTTLALAAALLLQADPAAVPPAAAEPATSSYQVRELGPGHAKTTGSTSAAPAPAKTAGSTSSSVYRSREPSGHTGAPATGTAPAGGEQK